MWPDPSLLLCVSLPSFIISCSSWDSWSNHHFPNRPLWCLVLQNGHPPSPVGFQSCVLWDILYGTVHSLPRGGQAIEIWRLNLPGLPQFGWCVFIKAGRNLGFRCIYNLQVPTSRKAFEVTTADFCLSELTCPHISLLHEQIALVGFLWWLSF